MSEVAEVKEGRWEGVREVMAMSWPIILGSLSYTVMDFSDKFMAGWLGTAALAAAPAAALWSFTLSTMFLGALGCVSTFVAQSLGREDYENCGRYAWQGLYLAVAAGAATVLFWPVSTFIFSHTQMSAEAQQLAEGFFQIRLLGYIAMAWCTVLAAFFQAVSRPFLPMWASIFCCVENVVLGYILMFGKFGLPEMGVNGLALGTVLSQYTQMAILTYWFLTGEIAAKYRTRHAWAFQSRRMLDVLRIGIPGGLTFLFDVLNWALFTTQIVGRDGDIVLAGHNAAIGLMHVAIMPAFALNNGIAAIVGQWIGRGRPDIAKKRTYVAIWIAVVYMTLIGFLNAGIGQWFIETIYKAPHDVAVIGQHFLYFAAAFEAFDALFFVTMGALRGAGDTKWTMWATIIGNYAVFMPLALLLAIGFGYGAYGGWAAATIYVMGLSYVVLRRFRGEEWRKISIFSPVAKASESALPEGAAATENAV